MTLNNWFDTTLKNRSKDYCDFDFTIKPYTFTPKPFLESCREQALTLSKTYDKLYVAYSGGLDSELVLKCFIEQDLPITPILLETPYNKIESEWAKEYCHNNSIQLKILNLSEEQFITELKSRTIDKCLPILLGGLPLIIGDYIKEDGGRLLTGYGECLWPDLGKTNLLEFCEYDYYLDVHDDCHPSGFLTYSLEVLHSLVNDIDMNIDIQEAKSKLYGLNPRDKMYWRDDYRDIQRQLTPLLNFKIRKYLNRDKFLESVL
jgi:hypothetical protein